MDVTRRQLTTALALLAVFTAAVLLERVIVTRKEKVTNAVKDMAAACDKGDVAGIFAHVSPDYRDGRMNYTRLRDLAAAFFKLAGPVHVAVRQAVVRVDKTTATAEVDMAARAASGDMAGTSQWRMEFEEGPDGEWMLVRLTPLKVNQRDISGWGDIIQMVHSP
jgi:hypothetical protein